MAITLLGANAPLAAAQVVPGDVVNENPGFTVDLDGWRSWVSVFPDSPDASIVWSPVDLRGEPGSGSVLVSGPPGVYRLYGCFRADFLWQKGHSIRVEVDTGSLGSHSRVFAFVWFGFAGDQGETGNCVGPATSMLEAVDSWLDVPGVVRHVSPSTFVGRPGPLVTFAVQVNKFDADAIFIDNVRLIADGEIQFQSDFE